MPRLNRLSRARLAVALSVALLGAGFAGAALATARSADVPPPRDVPYPGTITLAVGATDTRQGIFRVHETIPVKPGKLILLFPEWIPGNHAPDPENIDKLAGLVITANGKRIPWSRNTDNVWAFHVDVPAGVSELDVKFQFLSARARDQGPIIMTNKMIDMSWNQVSLYPAGYYTRDITFKPSVTFPKGWQFGTALTRASESGDTTTFKPVTYNTLVDSPIYAGLNFRRIDLTPAGAKAPVHMDIVGDSTADLAVTPHELQLLRNMVAQEHDLMQSHHYDHYDFLLSVSDHLAMNGLEHHQSSEDGEKANFFTDWKAHEAGLGGLLAHEYTHSWNGKFMRPADLWTPNFNVPMGDALLWVYEGQTQYWGYVLTARAGMWTPEQYRNAMALLAATYARDRPGFAWRNIQDTTNDEVIAHRTPQPYLSWETGEMYYNAGQLIWLGVDAKIRELTHDKKSLNTFAKDFFGVDNGSFVTHTYTFDDLVTALNKVAPYDWAHFLRVRLDAHQPPMGGLAAAGWKLVYNDTPNPIEQSVMKPHHFADFAFSIGLTLDKHGKISDVRWNGPAFKAGVGSSETLVAVNGKAYTPEVLTDAIKAAKTDKAPIELLLKYQGQYQTIPVDYHGGLQYPHLERIKGTPDYLDEIIAPLK